MFHRAQAVITKYRDPRGLQTTEIYLPRFRGLEGLRPGCQHGQALVRAPFGWQAADLPLSPHPASSEGMSS